MSTITANGAILRKKQVVPSWGDGDSSLFVGGQFNQKSRSSTMAIAPIQWSHVFNKYASQEIDEVVVR
jgi:hypothetical protein